VAIWEIGGEGDGRWKMGMEGVKVKEVRDEGT
jgi:hypothetical protein